MKRFHVHVAVSDLEASVKFYSAMFATVPTVYKPDYAKWMLDDPRINFAISQRGLAPGVDHLGIQVDSDEALGELRQQVAIAEIEASEQNNAACCYAQSDKYWTTDPQGIAWETFHTLANIPTFGQDTKTTSGESANACCAPAPERQTIGFFSRPNRPQASVKE
jgi:catechol 2,3-dioxygenase-like lactoylglutathione lyase family enzyme